MLALADPPATSPDLIPGLKYPAAWHREQESKEQAALNAYIRWTTRFRHTTPRG
ncbi:hypothetical protein [Streptomyces sp. NPDC001658]